MNVREAVVRVEGLKFGMIVVILALFLSDIARSASVKITDEDVARQYAAELEMTSAALKAEGALAKWNVDTDMTSNNSAKAVRRVPSVYMLT